MKSIEELKDELIKLVKIGKSRDSHIALIQWLDSIGIFEEEIDDGWNSIHFENKSYPALSEFYSFQVAGNIIINYSSSHCGKMLQNIRFFENNEFSRIVALSHIEFWDAVINEINYFIEEKDAIDLQKLIKKLKQSLKEWEA